MIQNVPSLIFKMASVLIKNGHILDLGLPFEPADVLVDGDRIIRVQASQEQTGARVIDATGKVVMPGLINGHTHSRQILERGLGDNEPLDMWLVQASLTSPTLTERELYALTAWSVLVQLKTGCTACLDHYRLRGPEFTQASADAIMQAYVDTGFRAAVAVVLGNIDFFQSLPLQLVKGEPVPSMGGPAPVRARDLLARVREFLKRWQGKEARLQPFIGPSRPEGCTDELLAGSFDLSREFDAGVHLHVCEVRREWFACQERFGTSPIAHFKRQGWLSPRLSCAHGVWLELPDMQLLADSGAAVVHNPVSNLRLGSGVANLQGLLSHGVTVALGADGASSNDNQNMWEVLKLTATLHKLYGHRTDWVSPAESLRLCLEGGARVLRQQIGAVQPGYQADLIILGGPDIFLRPKDQMIASLVYGELGQSVETALVAGEIVLEQGRSTRLNEARLRDEVVAILEKANRTTKERGKLLAERRLFIEKVLIAVEAQEGPKGLEIRLRG